MQWKKIFSFYVTIIVWVAIWGLVVRIGGDITSNGVQVYTYYIIVAIVGSLLLYFLKRENLQDDEDEDE